MEGVEQEGDGDIRVLIIPPVVERNTDALFSTLPPDYRAKFTFYTIRPLPRKSNHMVDFEQLMAKCRDVVKDENITALFSNKPLGSLVAAILCEEFPQLRGPSIESIFLCHHKHYTTSVVDARTRKFSHHVINLNEDIFDTAYELLNSFSVPGVVRACVGSGTSVYCFHNRDQLIKVLAQSKRDVGHLLELQGWLLDFIDAERYPLAKEPVCLLNPYLDRCLATEGCTWWSVCVEACVFRRTFIPWAMCNVVLLPYGKRQVTHGFSGFEMPTSVPADLQELTWKEFERDVNQLIQHGFSDSFVHAEYMVFENGYVHLVSLNGRLKAKCTNMYNKAMDNGDNVQAALDLANGVEPTKPTLNGNYVLTYSMVVFDSGKADALVYYDKALAHPDITLYYKPGQDIIIEPDKDFAVLGTITIQGKDFDDCFERVKALRPEILKIPELVPIVC